MPSRAQVQMAEVMRASRFLAGRWQSRGLTCRYRAHSAARRSPAGVVQGVTTYGRRTQPLSRADLARADLKDIRRRFICRIPSRGRDTPSPALVCSADSAAPSRTPCRNGHRGWRSYRHPKALPVNAKGQHATDATLNGKSGDQVSRTARTTADMTALHAVTIAGLKHFGQAVKGFARLSFTLAISLKRQK